MRALNELVRKNIQALSPYSSARDEFSGSAEILLDANENPYGNYNRYPDPYQKQLKEQLSELKSIPTENIFVGNGSDEAIDLLFRIFCEPGIDKALSFAPTYGMYRVSAQINNVDWKELPLNADFEVDIVSLSPLVSDERLKLIFICSPNNPTGNTIDRKSLMKVLDLFPGIVVIDEAYIDFSEEESALSLIENYPNLVVLQTLSKAWGQAGLRIGFAYAQKEIIQYFNKVKPPYNVSLANQTLAFQALQNSNRFNENITTIKQEKVKLEEALANIPQVLKIFPSETNFLLIKLKNATSIYKELVKHQIIVRDRSNQIEDTLRITVGSPAENKKLIQTLQLILA